MWQYNYTNENNELYHYGVPGMKWGARRGGGVRRIIVGGLERKRRKDERDYKKDKIKDALDPTINPVDRHKRSREKNQAFKLKDSKTAYDIAQQKAKIDPNYKGSDAYKETEKEYRKQRTKNAVRKILDPDTYKTY